MKFIPIYWFSLASMCLGCSEVADVMFVIDGSENVSTADFLHEVTFVASVPTQYHVSPNHVRFGVILYGSQVTSKISIVPNMENNQFVNEVTQLKQGGGQPLLFRALTEVRKEFSKNFRDGSKQIAIVIISDKLHNRHAVVREVGYLRKAGVTVLPVGVGQGVQESDLRDLLTFANPIHRINNFSDLYRLSKDIYNSVCRGSKIYETTSLPQPESQTSLQNSIVTVHSYKDGKQRFFIQKDGSSQTNEKGLQIEVPLLREMVEKQPAMRPYFISYSLLDIKDSKDKNQYDFVSSTPNTNKKVSGIIINNEIWLQTSTPMIKTFPKEKPWTSKTTDKPLDDRTSLHWMAKGVKDFKDFLKKLGGGSRKNPDQSSRKDSKSNTLLTSNKRIDLRMKKTEKREPNDKIKQQYAVRRRHDHVITHKESSNDDSYRQTQNKTASRNIARSNTRDVKERTSPHSKTYKQQKKETTTISYTTHSFVQQDSNVIYTTETPSKNRNERKSLQTQNNHSLESKLPKNVRTPKNPVYRNSILPEKDETTTARTDYKLLNHSKHNPNADRSVFTDNLSSGRRPVFTLSGTMDSNVFSIGNSLQSSSMKYDIKGGRLSQNGLGPSKIVHEKPQITSNLYSPSNEFYIENGVNSISYKEHFQRLMNPNSRPSETTKSPYSFDGSKLFSAGSLYAPYRNDHQAIDMMTPTTPVTTSGRRHKQPFYLTEQKYDQLIPSITESSTQPAMFDSEQLTTRNSQTFPPNFLALLGISLDNDAAPRARNIKNSPLVPALPQNNAEGYYHPETNVHFYRPAAAPASYRPSPWDEESENYSQNLPLPPYRQSQRHVEFNFRDQNCTKEIHPGDSRFYVESLMSRIEIRPCPPGTIFVSETCGCTKSFPVLEQFDCTPELHLTFDSDFSDMSGKSTVAVNRVSLRNNSAIFNGDGELRVWRFSGGYIGNQLMLKMRFKPTHFYQQKQLLVGNCKKNTTMSYGAMIDTKSREVVMSITTSNGTADIKIHFKMFHWNDMVMIYDGSEFKAILNGQKKVVPVFGNVEERLSPLCIGRCDRADYGFQGSIDNMELLFCVPKVWGSL